MYLLADIGGTTTRVAFSDDGKTLRDLTTFPTPATAEEGLVRLRGIAAKGGPRQNLTGLVIAIPGVIDRERGQLSASPNLPGWIVKPITLPLEETLQAPVT